MTIRQPFCPHYGSNQVVTPGAASASVAISPFDKNVTLLNTGANICYVRIGVGAQTATTADFPIPPNMARTITKSQESDTMAHISALGTTLQVMTGEGW